jgi:hypothetical protein
MATRDTTTDDRRFATSRPTMARREETKVSFLTTEFWAMVGVIIAILIAAAVSDSFGDRRAWLYVSIVATGYIISRGLAKAGVGHLPVGALRGRR